MQSSEMGFLRKFNRRIDTNTPRFRVGSSLIVAITRNLQSSYRLKLDELYENCTNAADWSFSPKCTSFIVRNNVLKLFCKLLPSGHNSVRTPRKSYRNSECVVTLFALGEKDGSEAAGHCNCKSSLSHWFFSSLEETHTHTHSILTCLIGKRFI